MAKNNKYIFINKSLFFPDKGILVIGDLHLGYEHMLRKSGIIVPITQINELIKELKKLIKGIKKEYSLKKIVFIGDIKHSFRFEWMEKREFIEVFEIIKKEVGKNNIIFIKGNHDTIDYSFNGKMKNYYVDEDTIFIHGHKQFKKIEDKKIKTIVMGHLHPSVVLSDRQNIKREKYKCFLVGKWKSKKIIILPSFLSMIEGSNVNEYDYAYEDYFSIIPKKNLLNFEVHVIGKDSVYNFGKVRSLIK